IAYILNNWIIDCAHRDNVSAGQSAVWYFVYINEIFCRDGTPEYNHTAKPPVESNWIPNCAVHPEACDFINASINQSVPYNVTITPKTGSYVKGTPIPLEATVDYCDGESKEEVTVVFGTDAGNFSESGTKVYENVTTNGKAGATLVCDAESANVTARVKDMKWFEIVDPTGCNGEYQPTLRIINLTDDANFTFSAAPEPGEVDGYVYEDPNCNCTYDQGEKGVENVTVELVNATTGVVATATNSDGYYEFTGVPAGDYTVRYNAGDLYVNGIPPYRTPKCDDGIDYINPTEGSVTVPEGGSARHNFGVELVPDITIDKLVNGKDSIIAERNDTVTFTLTITNTGLVNLTNLTVDDQFPLKQQDRGLTWTGWAEPPVDAALSSIGPGGWIDFDIHWWGYDTTTGHLAQFEPLEPGESFEITFNATVDPDAKGSYKNVGYVTAESEWGDVSDDHFAHVIVGVPEKVPVLTPFGVAALIGLLSLVAVLGISKSKGMRRKKR
ncbi:MAG: carboxypeptidase regulatory-like domain-containing protein, partial [Methanophagales archaeon]|nr:carboxypeptidase regulatory-like domain-containing protein [Methanophagales archaeon]